MDNMIHNSTAYNLTQQNNVDIIKQIQMNCDNITELQRIIIKHYANTYLIENIIMLFKRITTLTPYEINIFFREKVIRVLNRNGSILASSANQTQKDYLFKNIIKIPFLNNESLKQYTLVLDLDETLVHFTDDPNDANKGVLHFRPGLFEFLDKVSEYYELVVFTAATKEYADPILEAIEQNKIIFEYKLYREHTTIIGDDFVKDISKLGRDLSKVIIVDNMPQCFRLPKENGVFIRPFWGKDNEDCALIDLVPILISIAKEGLDVRKGLLHYKDEIINKVTSNFYRRNFIK
jgi:Dullard-like phosphatase family protein